MNLFKTFFLRNYLVDKKHISFFINFYFFFALIFSSSILVGFGSTISEISGYSYFGYSVSSCLIFLAFSISYFDMNLFSKERLLSSENTTHRASLPVSVNIIFFSDLVYSAFKSSFFIFCVFLCLLFYQPISWFSFIIFILGIMLSSAFGFLMALLLLKIKAPLNQVFVIFILPLFLTSDFFFPVKNSFLNFLSYINPLFYLNSSLRLAANPNFATFSTKFEIYGYPLVFLLSFVFLLLFTKNLMTHKS